MRLVFTLIALLYLPYSVQSQDSFKDVVEKVFYDERVFNLIFFDYKEMADTPFPLPEAKFAFVMPDSIIQSLYPNIMFDLASGWGKERMMHTMTYIKGSRGSVLINNGFRMNPSMRLLIRFVNFGVDRNKAFLEFNTTSRFRNDDMKGRYIWVKASLKKKHGQWRISHLSITDYPWQGYLFPEDEGSNGGVN